MWILIKQSALPYIHPEVVIMLACGYARVMVSPVEAKKWGQS